MKRNLVGDATENFEDWRLGFNAGLEKAALIVCPRPHKEEERDCKDVARAIRRLKVKK